MKSISYRSILYTATCKSLAPLIQKQPTFNTFYVVLQCFDTVGWARLQPVKIVPRNELSGGTINPTPVTYYVFTVGQLTMSKNHDKFWILSEV